MKLSIESTENGYIVEYPETLDDDVVVARKFVVERKEEFTHDKCEQHWDIKTLAEVCYVIADLFGVYGNKHADPPCRFVAECDCVIEKEYEDREELKVKDII